MSSDNVIESIGDSSDIDLHSISIEDDCDTDIYTLDEGEETLPNVVSDGQENREDVSTGDPSPDVSIGDPSPEVSTGDPSPEVSTGDPSPDVRCFSPLPSTSNDNITINLNNLRFSEASGINISPVNFHLKEESSDVKDIKVLSEDVEHQLPAVNSENIIECSSGSDDDNTPISIIDLERPRKRSRKRKKNVSSDIIDLLLDDEKTYYSDCEIVDVDQLIAENNAILDRPTEVIQLDDSVSCEPPQLPSVADFIHQTNSSRAPPKKKIHLLSRCESIITSFFQYNLQRPQEEPIIESRNHSFLLDSIVNLIPTITIPNDSENTNSDQLMPTERRRLRNRPNTQRQNVIEYIDLSQNSKPRLSEVVEIEIGIDINSSINAANSANPNPVQSQTPDSVPHGRIISVVDTTPIPAAISPTTDSAANEISTTGRISDCPICLETLIRGNIVSTYCGHIFCTTCMIKVKAARKRCPTCRKTLNGKGFHPIFL